MKKIITLISAIFVCISSFSQEKMNPHDYLIVGKKYSEEEIHDIFKDVKDFKDDIDLVDYSGHRIMTFSSISESGRKVATEALFLNNYLICYWDEYSIENGYTFNDYTNFIKEAKAEQHPYYDSEFVRRQYDGFVGLPENTYDIDDNSYMYVVLWGDGTPDDFGSYHVNIRVKDESVATFAVQNTFAGLELGKAYDDEQIKTATRDKGILSDSVKEGTYILYSYRDFNLGGHKWNYAYLFFTNDYEFSRISVSDSFADNPEGERNADKLFDSLTSTLSNKYATRVGLPDRNGARTILLSGNNGISCEMSNEVPRIEGNKWRFVKLEYECHSLIKKIQDQAADEL